MLNKIINFFKNYGTWILLSANIIILTFIIVGDPDFSAGFRALEQLSPMYALLCFVLFSMTFVCEGTQFFLILRMFDYHYSLIKCIRAIVVERYYSAITPTNIGGQPAIMFHLVSNGVPGTIAASAMSIRFMLYQFTQMAFLLVLFVTLPFLKLTISTIIFSALVIGAIFTGGIPLLLLLCVIWPRITYKVIHFTCMAAQKLRITKDGEALYGKAVETLLHYSQSMRMIRLKNAVAILVFAVVQFLAVVSVAYVACVACGVHTSYIQNVAYSIVLNTSVGFVPTPGATGATEGVFYSLFKSIIPGTYIMVVLLLWRVSSYYMTIIIGLLESGYTAIAAAVRKKRKKPAL